MDYQAYYRKVEDGNYQAYYDAIAAAEPRDPQATARTRDADGTIPGQARERMFNIAGEIQNTSREFGVPLPPLLEGCTVVDLCCGSGRDTYLAAQGHRRRAERRSHAHRREVPGKGNEAVRLRCS